LKFVNVSRGRVGDFCSKWFFDKGDKIYATRDYSKTLNSRMYYVRNQVVFHENPGLYHLAILHGLKS